MFKQLGISSVELLLSLTIISSISAYTLSMTEEVEKSIQVYQQETNVKELLKKIQSKTVKKQGTADQAEVTNVEVVEDLESSTEASEILTGSELLKNS